jgi:UPF0755 protein
MTEAEAGAGSFLDDATSGSQPGSRRAQRQRRRGPGCLIGLVILAVLFGGLYVGLTKGIDLIQDQFGSTPDYAGPGEEDVFFEVEDGDSIAQIGRNLKAADIVKSVDAFTQAASGDPAATGIQVGTYPMKTKMRAEDALAILVDPDNATAATVTIPEGLRVVDIVGILAKETDFSRKQFDKALEDTAALGLPDYAEGNPEGYLFPATYEFAPDAKPADMLKVMVDRWRQAADATGLEAKSQQLGYTPHELMTIAAMLEAEGRGDYTPMIARVIYNRLDNPDNGVTNGLLQIDATVNYALDRTLVAVPTTEDLQVDSPYNTYKYPGLPPGPIEAPGEAAIEAALNPAEGSWLFYVTVNLATGETKFTDSYDEFLEFKAELQDYCETQSDRC